VDSVDIFMYSVWQSVTLDGGEFRSLAGEFSKLRVITEEQWDFMEQLIRKL